MMVGQGKDLERGRFVVERADELEELPLPAPGGPVAG